MPHLYYIQMQALLNSIYCGGETLLQVPQFSDYGRTVMSLQHCMAVGESTTELVDWGGCYPYNYGEYGEGVWNSGESQSSLNLHRSVYFWVRERTLDPVVNQIQKQQCGFHPGRAWNCGPATFSMERGWGNSFIQSICVLWIEEDVQPRPPWHPVESALWVWGSRSLPGGNSQPSIRSLILVAGSKSDLIWMHAGL